MAQLVKLRSRAAKIAQLLELEYGSPDLGNHTDPLDEMLYALLSIRTDGVKQDKAYRELKRAFPSAGALASASVASIEESIASAGMGNRRALLIQKAVRAVVDEFGSASLDRLRKMDTANAERLLTSFPGVGPKIARCVLLYSLGRAVLPIDIHTYRIAIRTQLLPIDVSLEQSHRILPERIAEDDRHGFHVNAVAHGRVRCHSEGPECRGCPVRRFCRQATSTKPVRISARPRPLAIDLFAGAGGLGYGFRCAGFEIVHAVEKDEQAAATYSTNHPSTYVIASDITEYDPVVTLAQQGLRPGDISVVIGGPPCKGFSESNRRTRTTANPTNWLFREFFRVVESVRPQWFVLENVPGLATLERGTILGEIERTGERLGYSTRKLLLDAADYGVPQHRIRLFILGARDGRMTPVPRPTHGEGLKPHVSVWQAISDLPKLGVGASIDLLPYGKRRTEKLSEYQHAMRGCSDSQLVQGNLVTANSDLVVSRYRHIRQGQNWEAIPPVLMSNYSDKSRCHTGIYLRLLARRPSRVIGNFRKNMLIHPYQDRGLSVREAARLQSFPDMYTFTGSIGLQQQQVADAVPPLLAEAVAGAIRSQRNL